MAGPGQMHHHKLLVQVQLIQLMHVCNVDSDCLLYLVMIHVHSTKMWEMITVLLSTAVVCLEIITLVMVLVGTIDNGNCIYCKII